MTEVITVHGRKGAFEPRLAAELNKGYTLQNSGAGLANGEHITYWAILTISAETEKQNDTGKPQKVEPKAKIIDEQPPEPKTRGRKKKAVEPEPAKETRGRKKKVGETVKFS